MVPTVDFITQLVEERTLCCFEKVLDEDYCEDLTELLADICANLPTDITAVSASTIRETVAVAVLRAYTEAFPVDHPTVRELVTDNLVTIIALGIYEHKRDLTESEQRDLRKLRRRDMVDLMGCEYSPFAPTKVPFRRTYNLAVSKTRPEPISIATPSSKAPVVTDTLMTNDKAFRLASLAPELKQGPYKGSRDSRSFVEFRQCIVRTQKLYGWDSSTAFFYLLRHVDPVVRHEVEAIIDRSDNLSSSDKLATIWAGLESRFRTREDTCVLWRNWGKLRQEPNETMHSFLARFDEMKISIDRQFPGRLSDEELHSKLADATNVMYRKYLLVDFADLTFEKACDKLLILAEALPPTRSFAQPALPTNRPFTQPHTPKIQPGSFRYSHNTANLTNADETCARCEMRGHSAATCGETGVFQFAKRCHVCGAFDHRRDSCPNNENAQCARCGKLGHREAVCLRGWDDYWRARREKSGIATSQTPFGQRVAQQTMCIEEEERAQQDRMHPTELTAMGQTEGISSVTFGQRTTVDIPALFDTGAKRSFMHVATAESLVEQGVIQLADAQLCPTTSIVLGNGSTEIADITVQVPTVINGIACGKMTYLVCAKLSYCCVTSVTDIQ